MNNIELVVGQAYMIKFYRSYVTGFYRGALVVDGKTRYLFNLRGRREVFHAIHPSWVVEPVREGEGTR